jgi:DNA-binding PadR family transcriptional regulator
VSIETQTEQLAWVVLRAANRTQAKGSTARLVVPKAPEVAEEMGRELTDAQFRKVEEYLLDHGYVAEADIGLTWSSYTVTPAGLKWLEKRLPEPLLTDPLREFAKRRGEEEAFEWALRAELEVERRRMEEVERELAEEHPGAPETAAEEPERTEEPRSTTGGPQEGSERPWWRRVVGG